MDFTKLMKISLTDVSEMEHVRELYREADEIVERLGFTQGEADVAVEMNALRKKALDDVKMIVMKYPFNGEAEIKLEDSKYVLQRLFLENGTIVWEYRFYGLTDFEHSWSGRVMITTKELFELYKVEYLYEHFRNMIPNDFKAYYERYYGVAGTFKIFVESTKVR